MTRTLPSRRLLRAAPLCAALGACLWATPAAAQSAPATPPAPPAAAPTTAAATPAPATTATPAATPPGATRAAATPSGDDHVDLVTQGGRRVYVSQREIILIGERQQPYAFAVTGRGPLGYTAADEAVHFVDEIAASARRAPF